MQSGKRADLNFKKEKRNVAYTHRLSYKDKAKEEREGYLDRIATVNLWEAEKHFKQKEMHEARLQKLEEFE